MVYSILDRRSAAVVVPSCIEKGCSGEGIMPQVGKKGIKWGVDALSGVKKKTGETERTLTLQRRIPCVPLLAVSIVLAGVFLFSAGSPLAGVVGSPHDFSSDGPYTQSALIAPSGVCSACHIPHGADVSTLWNRDLTSYRSLLEANGGGAYQINYVHAPTIQCYDCHDNHSTGNIDDNPAYPGFSSSHKPQDIAFGGDGPRGVAGFYENNPPDNSALKGANPNLNPNDPAQLSRTGGHYFKYADPDGAGSAFRKGDKLPCRDCHDPHAYSNTWRVFIRNDLPNAGDVTNLTPLYGSELMANLSTGPHDNLSSRRICVSCHAYSNTGTLPVQHSQVSSAYTDTSRIPKPPATVNEHTNSPSVQSVPCTLCHNHGAIDPNCAGCHGFPSNPYSPSRNASPAFGPYDTRDPHAQHTGRADGQPLNSFSVYGFTCNVCHATSALGSRPPQPGIHKNGAYNIAYDLSGLGVPNPPDVASSGRLTCANVYCHSNGGSDNTMGGAGNYYRTVQWGVTPVPLTCSGCHGTGSIPGTSQFGMPGYTGGPAGSKTANTHLAHVVNGGYECSVCHFNTVAGTYKTARTIKGPSNAYHVNGSREVAFDNTVAVGSYNIDETVQANNKRCDVSCHGTGKPMSQRPQWGGTLPFGCLECHAGPEQIYKPQIDYGIARTPNPLDNAEYLHSGHGRSSAQGNYPGSGNPPAGFSNFTIAPVSCYVCHSSTAPHTSKSANDPFRLGSAADNTLGGFGGTGGFTGAWADNTDGLCLGCHGDSTQRANHDNAAKGTTTIDALTHARGITGTKYNWPNSPWKCVDCHDPHGDGKSGAERFMMLRSGINAPADNTDANAGSDVKSIPKRTDANVRSVTFDSLAGYAAGSYVQAGNGAGGTWGPCEVCHTQTTAYSRTLDNTATHAGRTSRCTTCHPHALGFAPTCFGCHGASGNRQYWPAGSPGTYPNRAGAHGNHVDTLGSWLFQETSATGLLTNTGKGSTSTKQIAICGWCHPNPGDSRPGTGEPDHMDNAWTPGIADVHRDGRTGATASYLRYFNGNPAAPGGVNDNLAAFDNASHTCSNTLCHNKAATPATWNAPPAWGTDNCASTMCHPSGAQATGGVHAIHINPKVVGSPTGGMGYSCSECHVVPTSLRHGNGQANLGFGGIEASVGMGNGFYDKDDSGGGAPSAGDNDFRAYDGSHHHACVNIYCHGGDNPEWRGSYTMPAWDNTGYVAMFQCGPCHALFGSPYDSSGVAKVPFSVGSHEVHYKQYTGVAGVESVNRGPRIEPGPHSLGCATCHNMGSNCTTCHATHGESGASQPTSTHADGKVDFKPTAGTPAMGANPPAGVTLAATPACDYCHSTATVATRTYPAPGTTGVAAAKANWDNGSFRLDCLTCHNGTAPGNGKAGGEGIAAPDVYGDGTGYGAEARGHDRPASSGNYPGTGNPAANRICGECHNTSSLHITGVNDNTFDGNRLLDNVNGVTGITTDSGLCSACHTNAGTSPATKKSINTHGNTGFPKRLEDNTFALGCPQCHEPHGMVNVSAGAAGVNLWMINPTITVTAGITVSPVRLFAKSGANSFNPYDPGAGNERNASLYAANAPDQICAVCHANSSAAGFPMKWNIGARHNAPGYAGNESGKNCSTCHSHDQDGGIGTTDGLMPMACNDCHSYPGLDNAGVMKLMSTGHRKHVGQSFAGGDDTNNKGYECSLCHFNYDHNQLGLAKGQAWPANYYDNVNIRFDNAWNPGTPTYAGVNAGITGNATGNGGTGACAGLYCHGGNGSLNARWGGSATTPAWSGNVPCGACHDTGRSDTSPGTSIATGNHPTHIDNAYIYGPGMASFSPGGGCAEGTGCHPRYDLTPNAQGGLHANNLKDLRSTPTDNGNVGATLAITQVCRNCHSTYTSAHIPISGDAQVRTQANWDDNTFWVDCLTCHNGTAAGTQATAGIDGSGGVAAAIEGTLYNTQHGAMGVGCGWCHGDVGHIGSGRQTGTNPWRLGGYFLSDFATPGRIDYVCDYCHQMFGPPDHYWRVSGSGAYGPETKGPTETHPTTVLAVGTDKDRWYQVPSGAYMPLFGDLMDNNYNRSGGTNNHVLCVSCHDPHGVGPSPIPSSVRRFSGQNTDAKGYKSLRFNYSSGTPTPLCSQCHK